MNTKHTPGPWKVASDTNGKPLEYENGTKVKVMSTDRSMFYAGIGGLNKESDAALIAAAPDTLLALKRIVGLIEMPNYPCLDREILKQAKAAIAKAEGGK